MFLYNGLENFPKYMNQFGCLTTLRLERGINVLEMGMVGTRCIVSYVQWEYLLYSPIYIIVCIITYHIVYIRNLYLQQQTPYDNPNYKIILKSSWISYELIHPFRKRRGISFFKTYAQIIWEVMRNQSPISLYLLKLNIFFPLLHFAMESLVPTTGISSHAPYGNDNTYQIHYLDQIEVS